MQLGLQQLFVRQLDLILRDQRGRQAAVKGVLDDFVILAGTEQDTDSRVFMRFAFFAIQSFQIEAQLAQILRFKTPDLELDGHQAVETPMKEQQIQRKITPADLNRVLGADKAEIAAQFAQTAPP